MINLDYHNIKVKKAYKKLIQYKTFSITLQKWYIILVIVNSKIIERKKRLQNVLKIDNIDDEVKKHVFKDKKVF